MKRYGPDQWSRRNDTFMADFKIISQAPVGIDDYFADCVYGDEDTPIKVIITGPAL